MTPAEKPRDAASTRRLVIFTTDGKNTTAAPKPVEAEAPKTNAKAIPALSWVDIMEENPMWDGSIFKRE
jgi:hypothetical protein